MTDQSHSPLQNDSRGRNDSESSDDSVRANTSNQPESTAEPSFVVYFAVSTVLLSVLASAMPARFRLYGLFPVAIGLVGGLSAKTWFVSHTNRGWRSAAFALQAGVVWLVCSFMGWQSYVRHVDKTWAADPGAMVQVLTRDRSADAPSAANAEQIQELDRKSVV